ncbi:MAG TPA: uroporphyrinogen-III synthase [Niabella sp.]|nr:uroporphyrinogen-III synthase [Niabella sp.]HOZ98038.1 uroporphyrinogen-III synthase [Niabella sp.]HQW14817.1 uroporphyrinogen-III synthase [Niabella sp.]HQX18558.1 uroporphyrinogen-III synthase [Niabella sp.]HQX40778.1 uroporphyrinogen-III synthase [Niabella sp.]
MPDVKKKILSTRALDQEVISKARVQGIWIDCIPFIDIRYKSEKDIAGQFKDISESDIFIFTSQHAVKAAYELIKNLSNSSYCISGVTRQEVQQTRLKILANADYASDLVLLMERNSDLQYILFCGDKRLPTIPDFFIAQKLHLQEVVCYENIASPQRVTEQYDGVMFYSPSGVESYFSVNEINKNQHYYCIGNTTAKAIAKYINQNIIIGERPTIQAMMDKIMEE